MTWYALKVEEGLREGVSPLMPARVDLVDLAEAVEEIPRTKGERYRLVGPETSVELFLPPERVKWADLAKQVWLVPMVERRFQEIMTLASERADWRAMPWVTPETIRPALMRVPTEHLETLNWLQLMVSLKVNGTAIGYIGEAQREYAAGERCWRMFGINKGDLKYAMDNLEAAEGCLGARTQYAKLDEFKGALRVWRADVIKRESRR